MDVSAGFFQNAKSGDNYIRFLLYTTTQPNDSIKIQYSIDPTGAWSDSDFADAGGLQNLGTYTYTTIAGCLRVVGSRVHFMYSFYVGNVETLAYGYSDDDGETWTLDNAGALEDGSNVGLGADMLDVFALSGTPFGLLMNLDDTGTVKIYDLTDFSEVYSVGFWDGTPGYIDGTNYIFSRHKGTENSLIVTFDGTNFTNEDTGLSPIGDPIGSILLKKGNLQFLILAAFGASNDLILIKYGDDPWSEFDFGGTNYDLKVGWEEDKYEPRFIHVGGNVDDLYYISEGGSLIKIDEDVTETVVNGIGQFFHPYEITFEELDVYDSKLYEEHLKSSILTVESSSQLFTQGIGIVYRDLNLIKVFVGNVEEIDTDLDGQFVKFSTPAKDDLEREVTVSFIAQKSSEILQFLLDNKCKFLHGTIAATTNTFTIKWDNTKIKEIIQWAENEEFKIFYWDDEGDSSLDAGTTGSTTLNENLGDMTEIKIKDLGRKFNGILLRGGLKDDGTIARLLRSDQKTSGIQLNIFTIDVPQMTDDEDLPNHEMYDYGTQVLANLNSAFRNLRMTIIEKGHLQIGNRGIVISQEYGISSEDYIFFKNVYFPEEGNTKIDNSYNGLYFIVNSEETLPEANREVLGQVSEELNNLGQTGSIYYLDSNASDIGGYKKMLLAYASDIKEDLPVSGAINGDLIEEFVTEPEEPGITELLGGIYSTHIHASKTSGAGTKNVAIYFEIYKYEIDTTETLLGTSHSSDIFTGLDNVLQIHVHLEDEIILATDRILIKYYVAVTGNGAAPDIEMHIQGDTASRFIFPFNVPGAGGLQNIVEDLTPQLGADLDAQDFDINAVGSILFDILNGAASEEGRLKWNNVDGTIEVGMPGGEVNLQIGQELMFRVKNETGSLINNGNAVRISGTSGNNPTVGLAEADVFATAGVVGLATEDIAHNSFGYVTTFGYVRGLNTLGLNGGDRVYLSNTAGEWTTTPPIGTERLVFIGIVIAVSETEGSIWLHPLNQPYLPELSGVTITAPADNELLAYDAGSGIWINQTAIEAGIIKYTDIEALAAFVAGGLDLAPVDGELEKAISSDWAYDHSDNDVINVKHLTDAQLAALHAEAHTAASHSDQGATGAELEALTDGSETVLHKHAIDLAPVNGELLKPPSSDWAFDHSANAIINVKHLTNTELTYVQDKSTQFRYVPVHRDVATFLWSGSTTTNGAFVDIDVVAETSVETNITQSGEDWSGITIPSGAKAVNVNIMCRANTASASNRIYVFEKGIVNYGNQAYETSMTSSGYIWSINGTINLDVGHEFRILVSRGAGTIDVWVMILGYWI